MSRARGSLLLGLAALASTLVACSRSGAYKQDQQYYHDEPQSYYSSGAPKSPTQRLEQMGQPKKRVTVLNFWNDTPVKIQDLGAFSADELKRGLYLTQRMIVPTDARTELVTEDFVRGDDIKVAQLVREGRRLGVSVLVIGRITKIVFRSRGDEVGVFRQKQSICAVDVEIKVFDIQSGREIMATNRSGEASNNAMVAVEEGNLDSQAFRGELAKLAARNAVGLLAPEVIRSVEKLTWQGHIAKVTGSKIYINAGRASGLVPGDILKVLTSGEDIYDPATGAYLGRTQGQLKGTVEITDFIGTDGAVAELHTGGNFQEGDNVRLY